MPAPEVIRADEAINALLEARNIIGELYANEYIAERHRVLGEAIMLIGDTKEKLFDFMKLYGITPSVFGDYDDD